MAPQLTYKNITFLGLTQVGVVVAGVLAAGATYKAWTTFEIPLTQATRFAADYGFVVLAVPVLWITVAMAVQARDETSDAPEAVTFASGVLVLLALLVGAFQAAAMPWVRLFSCSFSLSA
jgi:hypothetical protein